MLTLFPCLVVFGPTLDLFFSSRSPNKSSSSPIVFPLYLLRLRSNSMGLRAGISLTTLIVPGRSILVDVGFSQTRRLDLSNLFRSLNSRSSSRATSICSVFLCSRNMLLSSWPFSMKSSSLIWFKPSVGKRPKGVLAAKGYPGKKPCLVEAVFSVPIFGRAFAVETLPPRRLRRCPDPVPCMLYWPPAWAMS